MGANSYQQMAIECPYYRLGTDKFERYILFMKVTFYATIYINNIINASIIFMVFCTYFAQFTAKIQPLNITGDRKQQNGLVNYPSVVAILH